MSKTDAKLAEEKTPIIRTKWLVDSGATQHFTHDRSLFTSYTPTENPDITLKVGNGAVVKITGVGDVCIRTSKGVDLVLKNVQHAPGLFGSFMSVPALEEQGYTSIFDSGKFRLARGSLVVAEVERVGKKYIITGYIVSGEDLLSKLWHKRLGHLNSYGVDKLSENKLIPGLQGSTTEQCVYCCLGGQVKQPSRKSDFLKLVHMAFHGPFCKPSLSGATFFVTFIDDFSRKTWCFALKKRCQVVKAFEEFRSSAEGQTGKKLKCVFQDQGHEYSSALDKYCKRRNVQYICVPLGAPSVNNLAETTSYNIRNKICWILVNAKLPMLYWEFALNATVHVLNLSPATSLNNDVPDRVWFGENASYDHLRVFGCRALARKANGMKRDCIFVGYAEKRAGYKFYDPCKMEVFVSNDAEFFEEESIDDMNMCKEEPQGATNAAKKRLLRLLRMLRQGN